MNKRIKKKRITLKKKREQKILKGFIKTIKHACLQILTAPVPPTPSFEQQCRMVENAYHKVCENAGYAVSDIVFSQSDHTGVINGEITLKPNYFPIDIKVIKGRRLTQTESDLVAVQDPIDTSEIDIGTL